ncbi:MAG: hypothetical protein ACT4O9_07255 [Blastocatellia bacterium]
MKTLLKIYSASCLIFVGFVLFFSIPFESLPLSGTSTAMLTGGAFAAVVVAYIFRLHRREGFEFGWFLANKGGFWFVTAACFGLFLFLSGLLIRIAPQAVEPAFERGAWPVAGGLVVLFWLAIIYMFGFLSFGLVGRATAFARIAQVKKALSTLALTALCLLLASLFFSLFLEVINDIFFRVSVDAQWIAIWIFAGALVAGGIFHAFWKDESYYLEADDIDGTANNQD